MKQFSLLDALSIDDHSTGDRIVDHQIELLKFSGVTTSGVANMNEKIISETEKFMLAVS